MAGFKWANPGCCCSTTIPLPACPCGATPTPIAMVSSNHVANNGIFQDATLVYGPSPAGTTGIIGTNSFTSTTTFTWAATGDTYWYYFHCVAGVYQLKAVFVTSAMGSPHVTSALYTWGATSNSCSPFAMTVGSVFPGGDASSVVTLTG